MKNNHMASKLEFVVRWALGTVIGWILAVMTAFTAAIGWEAIVDFTLRMFHFDSWLGGPIGDVLFIVLAMAPVALGGAVIGLAQWQLALQGQVSKREWISVSTISAYVGTFGFIFGMELSPGIFSTYGGIASGMDTGLKVLPSWPLAVLIQGTLLGLAIGLPQWFVLRRYAQKAGRWILANVIGGIVLFVSLVAIVSIIDSALIFMMLGCVAGPFVFGTVTGYVLFTLLVRDKTDSITTQDELSASHTSG